MQDFEPIRDYFHRRAAKKLNDRSINIRLLNQRTDSFAGSFVYPGINFVDSIKVDGQCVGYVDYGMSPLLDRVYINMINIDPETPRQWVAFGVLWQLWLLHQVPIVPLHQHILTNRFWSLARSQFAQAGALIEDELRTHVELQKDRQRWQHLVPESEKDRSNHEYSTWGGSESSSIEPRMQAYE